MHFTPEQRDSWAASTRDSPFNRWMRHRVSDAEGKLDLAALHSLAAEFGIQASAYAHLNPGQQRMNIGNRLRKLVPASVYEDQGRAAPAVPALPAASAEHAISPRPFDDASDRELMQFYALVIDELRARQVIRTANAPLGDYAEHLFAKAFGWSLENNSTSGHDAVDGNGVRYQIKARRLRSNAPGERQLSVIRRLPEARFDSLAAVLFDKSFDIHRAALIPCSVVLARSTYIAHVNGWRLILDDSVWLEPGVQDVTLPLREASGPAGLRHPAQAPITVGANASVKSGSGWIEAAVRWLRAR